MTRLDWSRSVSGCENDVVVLVVQRLERGIVESAVVRLAHYGHERTC